MEQARQSIDEILAKAERFRRQFGSGVHDKATAASYAAAADVARQAVHQEGQRRFDWDRWVDRLITSRWLGLPLMLGLLGMVFWLTIAGANVPSAFLAGVLMEQDGLSGWLAEYFGVQNAPAFLSVSVYEILHWLFAAVHAPPWLTGFLVDGVYLGLAWVVAVMLPPMAIFFPLFTLLEDLGYLPRVAFNLDRYFRAVGAHGKQALTMSMGFGCNAAGVIACRIIESPRERLIAILTNNFVPCNGRWPTMIMIASLFVAASVPAALATLVAVGSVTSIVLIGIGVTLLVSLFLSRTILKGVASSFTMEMPPYRRPKIGQVIYRSIIDRTLFVLKRAVICAAPAGGLIWLLGAIDVGNTNLFALLSGWLDPFGRAIGLDGVILLAFIFAIPANEIVVPTIIMGYMQAGRMLEIDDPSRLFVDNGWTLITAICVMLFSLLHYPCTTTSLTIWAETRSIKWTLLANVIPLTIALIVCAVVANVGRMILG